LTDLIAEYVPQVGHWRTAKSCAYQAFLRGPDAGFAAIDFRA
jgi:hypothetical protein